MQATTTTYNIQHLATHTHAKLNKTTRTDLYIIYKQRIVCKIPHVICVLYNMDGNALVLSCVGCVVCIACTRESVTIYGKNHYLCGARPWSHRQCVSAMPSTKPSALINSNARWLACALEPQLHATLAHKRRQNNRCFYAHRCIVYLKFTFGPAHSGNFSAAVYKSAGSRCV